MKHAGIALLMMVPFAYFGEVNAGAAFACGWFISREHAHRQSKLSRERLVGLVDIKWWEGFTGWSRDRWIDAGGPVVATCSVVIISQLWS